VNVAPLAYAAGASVLLLMCVRFVFTAVVSSSLSRGGWLNKSITRQDTFWLVVASLTLAGQSFGYMASVNFLPVSVAVILFYTFPILTFVLTVIMDGGPLKLAPFMALAVALAGIYLLVQDGVQSWNMVGVFWAFFAAVMQAVINVITPKIKSVSGWELVKYTSLLPAAAFLTIYLADRGGFSISAVSWTLGAALVFCLGLYFFYRSVSVIGPVRTANLLYIEPVFTLILSLFIFGERLQPMQWLGIAIIFLATSSLELQERKLSITR
jgi:drug/metabolite transporter (DMT)-like permease